MTDTALAPQQQTTFDTAFNMLVPQAKPAGTAPLPFYPAQRYVDKNLAPETTLTHDDVTALANARKTAEANGVLTPELGAQLLPIAMTEGHSENFGVRADLGLSPKPSTLDRFTKMGLTVTDLTDPKEMALRQWDVAKSDPATPGAMKYYRKDPGFTRNAEGTNQPLLIPVPNPPTGDMVITQEPGQPKMLGISGGRGTVLSQPGIGPAEAPGSDRYARIMAAVLAEKAAVDPTKTVDGAIKRYNGRGSGVEIDAGQAIPANVDTYLAKVKGAASMLDHPFNGALVQHFNATYKKK